MRLSLIYLCFFAVSCVGFRGNIPLSLPRFPSRVLRATLSPLSASAHSSSLVDNTKGPPPRSLHTNARSRAFPLTFSCPPGYSPASPGPLNESPPKESSSLLLTERTDLCRGILSNGLEYLVLPTAYSDDDSTGGGNSGVTGVHQGGSGVGVGGVDAHLEILSGSADERDDQQGMAHLLEHVTFMNSPLRARLAEAGARSNAYTDFHHTVYHTSCPPDPTPSHSSHISSSREGRLNLLLPAALDALADVIQTRGVINTEAGNSRIPEWILSKERAAVLSEMAMVNSIEHRVDRDVISALHKDNVLSSRFPIGREEQINQWDVDAVQEFHNTHYRPPNAVLYVVGDVDKAAAVKMIKAKFGSLPVSASVTTATTDTGSTDFPIVRQIKRPAQLLNGAFAFSTRHVDDSGSSSSISSSNNSSSNNSSSVTVNRHFPPVVHNWINCSVGNSNNSSSSSSNSGNSSIGGNPHAVYVHLHRQLPHLSFHMLTKRPLTAIRSIADLKADIERRIVIQAVLTRLAIRNMGSSSNSGESSSSLLDMGLSLDSLPREGCEVCALDLICAATTSHHSAHDHQDEHRTGNGQGESGVQSCGRADEGGGERDCDRSDREGSRNMMGWSGAVYNAVRELATVAREGLSDSELRRCVSIASRDAHTAYARYRDSSDSGSTGNEELVASLMHDEACGHTHLSPLARREYTLDILQHRERREGKEGGVTLAGVNAAAVDLFGHLNTEYVTTNSPNSNSNSIGAAATSSEGKRQGGCNGEDVLFPSTIVACAPILRTRRHQRDRGGQREKGGHILQRNEVAAVVLRAIRDAAIGSTNSSSSSGGDSSSTDFPPLSLLSLGEINEWVAGVRARGEEPPYWKSATVSSIDSSNSRPAFSDCLSNDIRVSFRPMDSEPHTASIRLMFKPEERRGDNMTQTPASAAAILLGAKTVQEGGSFRGISRSAVEMFCLEHNILLEVIPRTDGGINIDIKVPTDPQDRGEGGGIGTGAGMGEIAAPLVSNLEAAMQVVRILVTELKWEEGSFQRAKQLLREDIREVSSSMEQRCRYEIEKVFSPTAALMSPLSLSMTPGGGAEGTSESGVDEMLDSLQLHSTPGGSIDGSSSGGSRDDRMEVAATMTRLLSPRRMEVAVAGDAAVDRVRELALSYLGTLDTSSYSGTLNTDSATDPNTDTHIRPRDSTEPSPSSTSASARPSSPLTPPLTTSLTRVVDLGDEEEADGWHDIGMGRGEGEGPRASVGYVAGAIPPLVILSNKNINNAKSDDSPTTADGMTDRFYTSLLLLQDIATRRLFTVVREERQLTYDAEFKIQFNSDSDAGSESANRDSGYYVASVTALPHLLPAAIDACKDALDSLTSGSCDSSRYDGRAGITEEQLQAAKKSVLTSYYTNSKSPQFWLDRRNLQQFGVGFRSFEKAVHAISLKDINNLSHMLLSPNLPKLTVSGTAARPRNNKPNTPL